MNKIILSLFDEEGNSIGATFSLVVPRIGESIILDKDKKLFKVKDVIHHNNIEYSQHCTHVHLYLEYIKDVN